MNKDRKKHRIVIVVFAVVFGLAFTGLLTCAIWDNIVSEKSIVRLGDYSSLTYTATDRDTAGTQVTEQIVKRTRFGGLVKKEADKMYDSSMEHYREEAEYLGVSFSDYLKHIYGTDEKSFSKSVRESALTVAKEEAVLDAIADLEGITLTEIRFERLIYKYMESAGYTDREQFLKDNDEKEMRRMMRRELTVDWLLEHATGPALDEGDTE